MPVHPGLLMSPSPTSQGISERRNVRAAPSKPATTYQEVIEFDLYPHRQCQSLVEGEARPWHQDVLAWVGQHCQGKLYGLAAATR